MGPRDRALRGGSHNGREGGGGDKGSTQQRSFALRLTLTRTALRLLIELHLIKQLESHGRAAYVVPTQPPDAR